MADAHGVHFRRRLLYLLAVLLGWLMAQTAWAQTPPGSASPARDGWASAGFLYADGAMPVYAHGDHVEPYFAVKALLMAHRLGLDVRPEAQAFADWLRPRQRPDGRFARYCRASPASPWVECGAADADDALAALWCLLAMDVLPDRRSDASCERSLDLLVRLWNPKQQVYRTMLDRPFAQFADNVEILATLQRLWQPDARERLRSALERVGDRLSVADLRRGMEKTFAYSFAEGVFPRKAADFSDPSQPRDFYPDGVTPLYIWVYGLQPEAAARAGWYRWKQAYRENWLGGRADAFPWGLAAVAAETVGDRDSSRQWMEQSDGWRAAGRWNLLEEGVWRGLHHRLSAGAQAPLRTRQP